MKPIFTVPNVISMIRLIMVPAIAVTYLKGQFAWAIVLLCLSGLSDLLDGYIARHFNAISDFGKLIDPLADKLTTATVVICLMVRHPMVRPVVAVLLVKEIVMLAGAACLYRTGTRPAEAKLWGKLATASLYALMLLLVGDDLLESLGFAFLPEVFFWVLCGISCLSMILAFLQYTKIFLAIRRGDYNVETEQFEVSAEPSNDARRDS